jgi:hypothetical protein
LLMSFSPLYLELACKGTGPIPYNFNTLVRRTLLVSGCTDKTVKLWDAAGAVRGAVQQGVERLEQALAVSRRIAWVSLAASVVALVASLGLVLARVLH